MTWKKLLEQGRVERHGTSREELAALQSVVDRNLRDAGIEAVSADTRFACAYEAALILATAVIFSTGYRVKGHGHHRSTFEALPFAMPDHETEIDALYFDRCRRLRNEFSYTVAGLVDVAEVNELRVRVESFRMRVAATLDKRFPGNSEKKAE